MYDAQVKTHSARKLEDSGIFSFAVRVGLTYMWR